MRKTTAGILLMMLLLVSWGCQHKPKGPVEVIDNRWADIRLSQNPEVKTVWVDRQVIGEGGSFQGLWIKTTYVKPSVVIKPGRLPAHIDESYLSVDCKRREVYETGSYRLFDSKNRPVAKKNDLTRQPRPLPLDGTVIKLTQYVCGPVLPTTTTSSATVAPAATTASPAAASPAQSAKPAEPMVPLEPITERLPQTAPTSAEDLATP